MKNKNRKPPSTPIGTEVWFEDEDDCIVDDNVKITFANMNHYFRILCEKKGAAREEALSFLVEAFTKKPGSFNKFFGKSFHVLLCCCLSVIREGSADEIQLASCVIGLLAMTVDSLDDVREVYEKSIPTFSRALECKLKAWNVVDSLAIMTIFTAESSHETEEVMKLIWNLIDLEPTDLLSGHPPSVVATALSAWAFLLSSVDWWRLSSKNWKSVIPCLLSLLNTSNEALAIAASETLELICGFDSLENFSTEANSINVQEIKQKTKKHLGGKPKKENIDVCIGHQKIALSGWSQVLQLNFIERFLGEEGLLKHMMENEYFSRVFKFCPRRRIHVARTLYLPDREEATVSFFLPKPCTAGDYPFSDFTVSDDSKQLFKTMSKTEYAWFCKAKTVLRSKQRAASKESDSFTIMDENQGPVC